MIFRYYMSILAAGLVAVSCSTGSNKQGDAPIQTLEFSVLQNLVSGSGKDVIRLLGPPQKIVAKSEVSPEKWIYLDQFRRQATFEINSADGKIRSILLEMGEKPGEINFGDLKKFYPKSRFVKGRSLNEPNDVSELPPVNFFDRELGLTVLVLEDNQEIKALSWIDPKEKQRNAASSSQNGER